MIVDGLIAIVGGVINLLLAPLDVINFVVDLASSVSVVQGFISVVAYIFPWSHIAPLISIVVGFFAFRAVVALIKTVWDLLPIL